jgi:hypothetical protein
MIHLGNQRSPADDLLSQDMLLRMLAGIDSLLLITEAAEKALKDNPPPKGRPSEEQFRNHQFGRMLRDYRKLFGGSPTSKKKTGETFDGTWHIWVEGILSLARAHLKKAGLEVERLPKANEWAGRAAYDWLAEKAEKSGRSKDRDATGKAKRVKGKNSPAPG